VTLGSDLSKRQRKLYIGIKSIQQ